MCYISRPGCGTCYLLCAGVGVLGSQLYAAGGHDGPLVRKSVEVYDAQTNTWRLVCDMNMCRRNAGQTHAAVTNTGITELLTHTSAASPPGVCAINGLLYVIGGDDGSCNLSSVEFYNPATDKWSLIPTNMSNGRSYAGESERVPSSPLSRRSFFDSSPSLQEWR